MNNKFVEVEIRRTLSGIKNFIHKLESNEYYSTNPTKFLEIVKSYVEAIENNFNDIPPLFLTDLLKFLNYDFIPILRYIQRSQTKHIPWSLIPNVEKIIRELLGDKYFILIRPQWHWNYSVLMNDIYSFLNDILFYFTRKRNLFTTDEKFHVISFPVLEKTNFLLHTIFGHEIGHFYQYKYFESFITEDWEKSKIDEYVAANPSLTSSLTAQKSKEALKIYKGMIREIIPDLVGYLLLGPSMLFSLHYFSLWNDDIDIPGNSTNYYPPLKFRIRTLFSKFSSDFKYLIKDDSIYSKTLIQFDKDLKNYLETENDIRSLESNKELEFAYKLFIDTKEDITNFLAEELKNKNFIIDKNRINTLVERINDTITPNEINNNPVTLSEIFLTGWIFYYSMLMDEKSLENFDEYKQAYDVLSKLLLKASNQIFIHDHWQKHVGT